MTDAKKKREKRFIDRLAAHFERPTALTIAKYALAGAIVGILLALAIAVVHLFIGITSEDTVSRDAFLALYFYAAILIPTCAFIPMRSALIRFFASRRFDLALASATGIGVSVSFQRPITRHIFASLSQLTALQLLALFVFPLALLTIYLASALVAMKKAPAKIVKPTFFGDSELRSFQEDMLNVRPDAERFAERVLNGGSSDSMVFGLDAPWGAGKSTFINFCELWWKSRADNNVIVYRFNPLQYEDRKGLLSKFVDDLISTIREHVFVPELQSTVSKYAELFKGERKLNLWGLEITLGSPRASIESAHKEVSRVLSTLPKRLIVIVDDLVACRIFCTSVIETTAWQALHPDGMAGAQKSAARVVDTPTTSAAGRCCSAGAIAR